MKSLRLATIAELTRLPNVFTAIADALLGAFFVGGDRLPHGSWIVGLLAVASACFYAGGVALNDFCDARIDARERPERPIPAGRATRRAVGQLGGALLAAGLFAAVVVAAARAVAGGSALRTVVTAALLAGAIVLYDAWAKRTPLGPLVMGSCRGLNVLLGMSVAVGPWQAGHFAVAIAVATYIAGLTWFARTETKTSRRAVLAAAAIVMLAGIALLAALPELAADLVPRAAAAPGQWRLLIAALGLFTAWRTLQAVIDPTPAQVQTTVAHGILSLVILDAAVCFAARGLAPAVMILALLLPAMALSRFLRLT